MAGRQQLRQDLAAGTKALRAWAAGVSGAWDNYALIHGFHYTYEDCRDLWVGLGGQVARLASDIDARVADSMWMEELQFHPVEWLHARQSIEEAQGRISDNRFGMTQNSLWALGSWKEPAAEKYRATVPLQRNAVELAWRTTRTMDSAADGLVAVGATYLADVLALVNGLNRSLPKTFQPEPPRTRDGKCLEVHLTRDGFLRVWQRHFDGFVGDLASAKVRMEDSAKICLEQSVASDVVPHDVVPRTSVAGAFGAPWPTM